MSNRGDDMPSEEYYKKEIIRVRQLLNDAWYDRPDYTGSTEKKMPDSLQPIKENYFQTMKRINPTLYNLFEKCAEKIVKKNHDYAGEGDFYKNFRKSERTKVPAWHGIFLRFQDKESRIEQFINTGILKVEDESIVDTLVDGANYLLLMCACYLDDKKTKEVVDQRDAA